jgi:hypothetical protein
MPSEPMPDAASPVGQAPPFDLLCQFINELSDRDGRHAASGAARPIDWQALRSAARGARSLEEAVGRAVVVANQMVQEGHVSTFPEPGTASWSLRSHPLMTARAAGSYVMAATRRVFVAPCQAPPRRRAAF